MYCLSNDKSFDGNTCHLSLTFMKKTIVNRKGLLPRRCTWKTYSSSRHIGNSTFLKTPGGSLLIVLLAASVSKLQLQAISVLLLFNSYSQYKSLVAPWNYIRTDITCKKIPCYMRDSDCRWFIVEKKLKYFDVMLNIFEFLWALTNIKSWFIYENKFFWFAQPYFLTEIIKQSKLVPASFSCFEDF